MAVNKEIAEIGKDLLSQISSDDQDDLELGNDNELHDQNDDLDAGDQNDKDDKFQNEFEGDEDHDASDLGSDAPKRDKTGDRKPEGKQPERKPATASVDDIWNPAIRLQQDKAGNLLDSKGQIVARAGRERKFFEDAKKRVSHEISQNTRLATNMTQIAAAAKELHSRYLGLQEQKGMFDKAGLSNDEQLQMLSVASEFKKDPISGIKKMLTMAAMQGVDLKTLGVAGGVDARAIAEEVKKTITEQIKPITDRETATAADRERFDEAKAVAQKFFTDNPDALEAREEMGTDKFNQMIFGAKQRFPDMSLSEIWLRIKLAASKAPAQEQGRDNRQEQRRPTGDVGNDRRNRRPARTTGTESFDDIGRSVLRDLQTSLRN